MEIRRGLSYQKRCEEVNRLYDKWSRTGLSNREVWRRYIYHRAHYHTAATLALRAYTTVRKTTNTFAHTAQGYLFTLSHALLHHSTSSFFGST